MMSDNESLAEAKRFLARQEEESVVLRGHQMPHQVVVISIGSRSLCTLLAG